MELNEEQIKQLNNTIYVAIEDTKAEKFTNERRIVHWISTPDVDRGRDIMKPKGMVSLDFEKTKTVFANHDYTKEIGKNVKLVATNDGVKATTYFSDKTAYAVDRYNMHVEGVLNSWSIGFGVVRDNKGNIKEGSVEWDDAKGIRTFNEWNLLEYSSTGIPMNPNAIDIAKSICKSAEMRSEIDNVELHLQVKATLDNYQKEISELKSLIEKSKTNNNAELKAEIEFLKSRLEKLTGTENKVDYELIRKQVRASLVGSVSELTGRKFK